MDSNELKWTEMMNNMKKCLFLSVFAIILVCCTEKNTPAGEPTKETVENRKVSQSVTNRYTNVRGSEMLYSSDTISYTYDGDKRVIVEDGKYYNYSLNDNKVLSLCHTITKYDYHGLQRDYQKTVLMMSWSGDSEPSSRTTEYSGSETFLDDSYTKPVSDAYKYDDKGRLIEETYDYTYNDKLLHGINTFTYEKNICDTHIEQLYEGQPYIIVESVEEYSDESLRYLMKRTGKWIKHSPKEDFIDEALYYTSEYDNMVTSIEYDQYNRETKEVTQKVYPDMTQETTTKTYEYNGLKCYGLEESTGSHIKTKYEITYIDL